MAKIPISIEKIKVQTNNRHEKDTNQETVKYLFKIIEKNDNWIPTYICERNDLVALRDMINKLIEETTTAEILRIPIEKADIIDKHYQTDPLCQGCPYKLTSKCKVCLFTLQSPLERKLYLALLKSYINFEVQYPLNWRGDKISIEGKSYDNPNNNFRDVLTVVDFFIQNPNANLCIYTDGHTYHERTEEQAQRDRNIDRKLQELGYQVLRYTGKDVNENLHKIINEIKNWVG